MKLSFFPFAKATLASFSEESHKVMQKKLTPTVNSRLIVDIPLTGNYNLLSKIVVRIVQNRFSFSRVFLFLPYARAEIVNLLSRKN